MRRLRLLAALLAAAILAPGLSRSEPMKGKKQYTPAEEAEIEELERDVTSYERAAEEHQARVRDILRREYHKRQAEFKARYAKSCVAADLEYKKQHQESIKLLEDFLGRYPKDPDWSPDVMFRLADLYFDQARFDYFELEEPPCEHLVDVQKRIPTVNGPDYLPAIKKWREIVESFPEYRQTDASIYMAGILTGDPVPYGMGLVDDAKPLYLGLVCRNRFDPLAPAVPPSTDECRPPAPENLQVDPYANCEPVAGAELELVDEGWMRIGDIHFDGRCQVPEAIAAFKKITAREESKLYSLALYKLAWSYYKYNEYQAAVDTFDKFVLRGDEAAATGGSPASVRAEAIVYLGYSFADPWPQMGEVLTEPSRAFEKMQAHYKDHLDWKHTRDVYESLGDALKEYGGKPMPGSAPSPDLIKHYMTAVDSWGASLEKWPFHERSPQVHEKILDTLNDLDAEIVEGQTLPEEKERITKLRQKITFYEKQIADFYRKPESCQTDYNWYCANETNRDAMAAASVLAENALLKVAFDRHAQAQNLDIEWTAERGIDEIAKVQDEQARKDFQAIYLDAASLYERFIATYPTSRQVPAIMYYLGDCYHQADQFEKAVTGYYEWIRARPTLVTQGLLKQEAFDDTIRRILNVRQTVVAFAKAKNDLIEPPIPDADTMEANPTPLPMDERFTKLITATDAFLGQFPEDKIAPGLAYNAGLLYYKHLMYDQALERFGKVMKSYCGKEQAKSAKLYMLAIHQARDDKKAFETVVRDFVDGKCGSDTDIAEAKQQKSQFELKGAETLANQGKHLDAAAEFYALYRSMDQTPDDPSRAAALFGAAVSYLVAGHYKTAIGLFEEFRTQFDKLNKFYPEAMFGLAQSYQRYFDYANAGKTYLQFAEDYDKYKNQKGNQWRPPEESTIKGDNPGLEARFNAAYFKEVEGDLKGAIPLYLDFEKRALQIKDPRAESALWSVALIYEKLGDKKKMLETMKSWRGRYGNSPDTDEVRIKVVDSWYRVAKMSNKKADWEQVVAAYVATGLAKADESLAIDTASKAAAWAGEAKFMLAEMAYAAGFKKYKLKWKGKFGRDADFFSAGFDAVATEYARARDAYLEVTQIPSIWIIAAMVRAGDMAMDARDKIVNAPVPKEVTKLDRDVPDANILGQFKMTLENVAQPTYYDSTLPFPCGAPLPQDADPSILDGVSEGEPQCDQLYQQDGQQPPTIVPNQFAARQAWVTAYNLALQGSIVDEWSKTALVRLNKYFTSEYPLNRDDLLEAESRP